MFENLTDRLSQAFAGDVFAKLTEDGGVVLFQGH